MISNSNPQQRNGRWWLTDIAISWCCMYELSLTEDCRLAGEDLGVSKWEFLHYRYAFKCRPWLSSGLDCWTPRLAPEQVLSRFYGSHDLILGTRPHGRLTHGWREKTFNWTGQKTGSKRQSEAIVCIAGIVVLFIVLLENCKIVVTCFNFYLFALRFLFPIFVLVVCILLFSMSKSHRMHTSQITALSHL